MLKLGASDTIDYRNEAFDEAVRRMGGVDVVLDPMSWQYMRRTLRPLSGVLRPSAKYLHILSTDWEANAEESSILTLLEGPYASRASCLYQPVGSSSRSPPPTPPPPTYHVPGTRNGARV